jgi:hypothetical protein
MTYSLYIWSKDYTPYMQLTHLSHSVTPDLLTAYTPYLQLTCISPTYIYNLSETLHTWPTYSYDLSSVSIRWATVYP